MKNTSVRLGDYYAGFVADQVASGRYGSASEIIREGLRLVEARQRARDALLTALEKGIASGPTKRSMDDIWRTARERAEAEGD